jgi:hypothetical protein
MCQFTLGYIKKKNEFICVNSHAIPYYTQRYQLAKTEILAILSKLSIYICCVVFLRCLLSLCFFGALAD